MQDVSAAHAAPARGSPVEVFFVAIWLGLTSFGGPIAHLGYFERTYVQRRRWLSADDYAGLVALCQLIPGPASSQVGFLVGLRRAGWAGAFAAWLGFTLPSALIMFMFAWLAPRLSGPLFEATLHGLKLVAVAIVGQAVLSMGRKLCPDLQRAAIGLLAATILLFVGGAAIQFIALASGALAGALLCRDVEAPARPPKLPIGRRMGLAAGAAFLLLLVGLPLAAQAAPRSMLDAAAIFYRAGALVFGGGHVVLPLLRDALVPTGWLTDNAFLSGYGAVQAVPGPLFTFAAYLGATIAPHGSGFGASAAWSLVAQIFLFLPGLLLAVAGLPLWSWISHQSIARGALAGVNAAVVGVLGAALYSPVSTSAIQSWRDLAIAFAAFMLLERWRVPPILIVVLCVGGSLASVLMR